MPSIIRNHKGVTFLELLAAMSIVVIAAGGLTYSLSALRLSLRKSEAANLVVNVESSLVSSFNNSKNYPDDPDPVRDSLRKGTITTLSIAVPFATAATNLNLTLGGTTSGFLSSSLGTCSGFSDSNCWLRYSVGFRKASGTSYPTYEFSYEIEVNPSISSIKKIGNINEYDLPLDPANYRLGDLKTKCDPANSMFMIGMNRDTGEALCVENPKTPCAVGTYPIGLKMVGNVVEMACTSKAKTAACPDNYSLWSFDPKLTDPRCPSGIGCVGPTIGSCVWTAADQWNFPNTFPSGGQIKQRAKGIVCPPYYFTNTTFSSCVWRRGPNHKNGVCHSTIDNRNHNSRTCYASSCPTAGPCTPPVPLPVGWVNPNNCGPAVPCSPYACWDGVSKINPAKGFFYSGNPVSVAPVDPAIIFTGDGKRELDCSHSAPIAATAQPCQPGAGGDVDGINQPAVWESGIVMDGVCKLEPTVTLIQPATAQ